MEKRVIELDRSKLYSKNMSNRAAIYRDNLAREVEREERRVPTPEIQSAPRRGVRSRSLPKEKSKIRPAWIVALVAVAALYIYLVSQYMSLTELSIKASGYQRTIESCDKEMSKLKKYSLSKIDPGKLETFILENDMEKVTRLEVDYLDLANEEVVIGYRGKADSGTAQATWEIIKKNVDQIIEFFL